MGDKQQNEVSGIQDMTREELIKLLQEKDIEITKLQRKLNCDFLPVDFVELADKGSGLDLDAIKRYSRQLILPELGPSGQILLRDSSVLIVGCGGLGCPAAIYLAAAGIGKLGLLDYDDVELNNLHRQILHTEARVSTPKAYSVIHSLKNLNSSVKCEPHREMISSINALDIIKNYDIVLDCTDNVATRYLLNDACFFAKKPLVSGSALRFEGQLTVYNYANGPCYRCLFPDPPPPETVTNCSDGGVLGVIPGIIGTLQALETIKIITKIGEVCSKRLLLFDGLELSFRIVKLRGQQNSCQLCGTHPIINTLIDYEQFCGAKATDKDGCIHLINEDKRMHVKELKKMIDQGSPFLLIDVRTPVEMNICSIPNSLNIPLKQLDDATSLLKIQEALDKKCTNKILCLCRRGNDSQRSVISLKRHFPKCEISDIAGGLTAWAAHIDPSFPVY